MTAARNLIVRTNIDTTGDITLTAGEGAGTGAINFSNTRAIVINGQNISLTADAAPTASNQDLTITATNAVNAAVGVVQIVINTPIDAGIGDLTLAAAGTAGSIISPSTTLFALKGNDIDLTGAVDGTSGAGLEVMAAGDIFMKARFDINILRLNAGKAIYFDAELRIEPRQEFSITAGSAPERAGRGGLQILAADHNNTLISINADIHVEQFIRITLGGDSLNASPAASLRFSSEKPVTLTANEIIFPHVYGMQIASNQDLTLIGQTSVSFGTLNPVPADRDGNLQPSGLNIGSGLLTIETPSLIFGSHPFTLTARRFDVDGICDETRCLRTP